MFAGWRRVQLTWELWFCARHSMVRILKLAKWHSWLQLHVLTCAVRLTFVPGERTRSLSGMTSSKMHFVEGERHHWIEEWASTKQSIQKRFNTIWWFWCRGVLLLSFEFLFWHRSCGLQVQTVKTQALEASNNARLLCVCEFSEILWRFSESRLGAALAWSFWSVKFASHSRRRRMMKVAVPFWLWTLMNFDELWCLALNPFLSFFPRPDITKKSKNTFRSDFSFPGILQAKQPSLAVKGEGQSFTTRLSLQIQEDVASLDLFRSV